MIIITSSNDSGRLALITELVTMSWRMGEEQMLPPLLYGVTAADDDESAWLRISFNSEAGLNIYKRSKGPISLPASK